MSTIVSPKDENDSMRNAIIESSRELFAKYGYKKTTMEDIAQALRKGKSSLYYYFKNKEEIFQAVIELEEYILFSKLKEIVDANVSAADKFRNYVLNRMDIISQLDNYMKALTEDVYGGYDFFEKLRRKGEKEEAAFLEQILGEGVQDGTFQVKNIHMAATGIAIALKGLEAPLVQSSANLSDFKIQVENILNILFYGVLKR